MEPAPRRDRGPHLATNDREAAGHRWAAEQWPLVRRMIHTSADFDFLTITRIHPRAVASGRAALRAGALLLTDTRMALAGISRARLAPFGCRVTCLGDDPRAALRARGGRHHPGGGGPGPGPRGNPGAGHLRNRQRPHRALQAPRAHPGGRVAPALVVGLPVGFVNAAEAKAALAALDVPHVTALGRKGGSSLAASVINALAIGCAEADKA